MSLLQIQPEIGTDPSPWFAVRTRSNQERNIATAFEFKNLEHYLPTYQTVSRWTDRKVVIQRPFFPGYVFCRFRLENRLPVLTTPGVVAVVGFGSEPAAIPDSQIETVRQVLGSGLATEPCPFLKEGQRIRVVRGPLQGVEGILLQKKADWKLVVSIDLLQRSLAVEVDQDSVKSV